MSFGARDVGTRSLERSDEEKSRCLNKDSCGLGDRKMATEVTVIERRKVPGCDRCEKHAATKTFYWNVGNAIDEWPDVSTSERYLLCERCLAVIQNSMSPRKRKAKS
jgi:hypothetical protein